MTMVDLYQMERHLASIMVRPGYNPQVRHTIGRL